MQILIQAITTTSIYILKIDLLITKYIYIYIYKYLYINKYIYST